MADDGEHDDGDGSDRDLYDSSDVNDSLVSFFVRSEAAVPPAPPCHSHGEAYAIFFSGFMTENSGNHGVPFSVMSSGDAAAPGSEDDEPAAPSQRQPRFRWCCGDGTTSHQRDEVLICGGSEASTAHKQ